jgi:copper chaperone
MPVSNKFFEKMELIVKTEKITIKGMSCGHCVMAVKKELHYLPVKVKNVQIGSAEVEYDETKIDINKIYTAIREAGYEVDK